MQFIFRKMYFAICPGVARADGFYIFIKLYNLIKIYLYNLLN